MLVKAAKEDVARYMDFAYSLAMDPTKSGYRLWSDGISTKEEFVECAWRSYRNGDREILLFVWDGAVEGWIQFFHIEQDRYLQTDGFLIRRHMEQALAEFLAYARAHYPGYELYLGFPKQNERAISFFQKRNCPRIEESYHDIFVFDGAAIQVETAGLVRVEEGSFSEFRKNYQTDPDTYWNAERIFSTLHEWRIYLLVRDGVTMGYVCARNGEIFGLGYRDDRFDKDVYKTLVTAILRDLQAAGYTHTVFFHDAESQPAALELGFRCAGEYVLYKESAR